MENKENLVTAMQTYDKNVIDIWKLQGDEETIEEAHEIRQITMEDISSIPFNVTQSNDMFVAQTNLTLNEMKLIFAIISQINIYDKEIPWVSMSSGSLAHLCEFTRGNSWRTLKEICETIGKKLVLVRNFRFRENKKIMKRDAFIPWLDGFIFEKETKMWHIHLSKSLCPFLLNLKKNFTSGNLNEFLDYKTLLGFRLHGYFLSQWGKSTSKLSSQQKLTYRIKKIISLDEIRGWANVPLKHAHYGNFKKCVLLPALKEINQLNYFFIKMEEIKSNGQNGKVVKIAFYATLGERNKKYQQITQNMKRELIKQVVLQKFNYSEEEWQTISHIPDKVFFEIFSEIKSEIKENGNYEKDELKQMFSQYIKIKGKEKPDLLKIEEFWESF